jgi:DnaJ family protein C protein 11
MSLYKASKCDLAGFYDPAPTDEDKQLVVRYAYQGRLHQVSVGDLEGLKLPRNAHREQQTQTT